MSRRTHAQIDADKLREAVRVTREYAVPEHISVILQVLADSIEAGTRTKGKKS